MKKGVKAVYHEPFNPVWKGNPYIEALKDLPEIDDFIEALRTDPVFPEDFRSLDKKMRKSLVDNVKLGFYPLSRHKELWDDIQTVIRSGYIGRNPLSGEDLKRIRAYEADNRVVNNTMGALALVGISGMGKTTSVRRCLSYFDRIIEHTEYSGVKFRRKQVIWLNVECPCSENVEDFCKMILSAFDEVLGSDYFNRFKCGNAHDMLINIKKLIELHGVGAVFIDELQHLAGPGNDLRQLNNVLTTFSNMAKVPVIIACTPQVKTLFNTTFRMTRRYTSAGTHNWYRIESVDDPDWQEWFGWLFSFQCTSSQTELTEDLLEVFYEKSQGILDVACTLFRKVQYFLISSPYEDQEIITREVVEDVFDFYFQPIVPIIEAIVNKDYTRMGELEDLLFEIDQDRSIVDYLKRSQFKEAEKTEPDIPGAKEDTRKTRLMEYFLDKNLSMKVADLESLVGAVCRARPESSFEETKDLVYDEILLHMTRQQEKDKAQSSFDYLLDGKYQGERDEF